MGSAGGTGGGAAGGGDAETVVPPPLLPPLLLAPPPQVLLETSTVTTTASPVEDAPMITDDPDESHTTLDAILLGDTVNAFRAAEVTLMVEVPIMVVVKLVSYTTILLIFAPEVTLRVAPLTFSETESLIVTSSPAKLVDGKNATASVSSIGINNLRFILRCISLINHQSMLCKAPV